MTEEQEAKRVAQKPKWIPIVLLVVVCSSVYLTFADEEVITQHTVNNRESEEILQTTIQNAAERTHTQKEVPIEPEAGNTEPAIKTPKKAKAGARHAYPSKNIVQDFPTIAAREEARRHDRVIVESMAYFAGMDGTLVEEWNNASKLYNASDLCINIMTSNRKIRYIDALLMMLMKGQSKERLLSFARINLLNIEHRPGKTAYPHLNKTLSRFDFLHVHNISKEHPVGKELTFSLALRLDTISGLDICVKSNLPYCLMIEDDALPASGFIDQLEKSVISPLRRRSLHASSISLYSYHSHAWSKYRLDKKPYIDKTYRQERSKDNSERRGEGIEEYVPSFRVKRSSVTFGAVANVYTAEMAKKLRDFLKSFGTKEGVGAADQLMNDKFVKKVRAPRMQVDPSLVNHIGFYSERRNVVSYVNSDVRFQLDAGDY